jgi:hypothetical protein
MLLLVGCLIGGYLLLRNFDDGREILGFDWLPRQATAQKLVCYSIVACMWFQIQGSLRWLRNGNQGGSYVRDKPDRAAT